MKIFIFSTLFLIIIWYFNTFKDWSWSYMACRPEECDDLRFKFMKFCKPGDPKTYIPGSPRWGRKFNCGDEWKIEDNFNDIFPTEWSDEQVYYILYKDKLIYYLFKIYIIMYITFICVNLLYYAMITLIDNSIKNHKYIKLKAD